MLNTHVSDAVSTSYPENSLRHVFPAGEIFMVSDDEWLGIAAAHYGLKSLSLSDAEQLPHGANVVLLLRHSLVNNDIRKTFRNARVMLVPIASFDPSLEAALYTQKLTMLTDYALACTQSRYWADNVRSLAGPLIFSTEEPHRSSGSAPETHLVCSLADELSAEAWLEPTIGIGQWVSVGTYCEFSMTAPSFTDWDAGFTIDGTAVASAMLVARDPRSDETAGKRIAAAGRLRADLITRGPITLQVEGGVLTSVRAGGDDFTDAAREATNPEYGLHTTELGIGTNQSIMPHVDWNINSQLNEGAGDVHLGYGDGITGAHIDFVIAKASHRFQAAT